MDRDKNIVSFSLYEIAGWQLGIDNIRVQLPPMQRGFVWKVNYNVPQS